MCATLTARRIYFALATMLLALVKIGEACPETNDCLFDHCRIEFQSANTHNQSNSTLICLAIKKALSCTNEVKCGSSGRICLLGFQASLKSLSKETQCPDSDTTEPKNTTQQGSTNNVNDTDCIPQLPNITSPEIRNFSEPIVYPTISLNNVLCVRHYYPTLRHCSMLGYSQLRSFGSHDIQTCSLPGTWHLLKHPDISIEVTSIRDDENSTFTKLDKVNVTLYNFECTLKATINYVATATGDKLPSTFSSDKYNQVKILDPIEFHISSDGQVASILAPWLNLTVVITKQDGFLAVVVQIPGDLTLSTEGLCTSQCPTHTINNDEVIKKDTCLADRNAALVKCLNDADLNNALHGASDEVTIPFIHACQLVVARSHSYSLLSFMKAIAKQYGFLHNRAPLIVPEPPINPPLPIPLSTTSTTTTTSSTGTTLTTLSSLIGNPIPSSTDDSTSDTVTCTDISSTTTSAISHSIASTTSRVSLPTNLPFELTPSSAVQSIPCVGITCLLLLLTITWLCKL